MPRLAGSRQQNRPHIRAETLRPSGPRRCSARHKRLGVPPAVAPNRASSASAAFKADFTAYLSAQGRADLRASAIAQARRIAGSFLDEVTVTRRAAEMRAGDAADRVRQFSERLAEVAVHGRDAVTVVNAKSGRLLFALNDAAEQDGPRLPPADRPRAGRAVRRRASRGHCGTD